MFPSFYIKRGDKLPAITRTLEDANENPVDLTGGAVAFRMQSIHGGSVLGGTATVVGPATAGNVRYDWTAGDTALEGVYIAEWEVVFSGTSRETFPNGGYDVIKITADIA